MPAGILTTCSPPARVDIALESGETNDRQLVHRISPEDPWRRIRNRWRAEGVFAGPPPQPPAYLIASSGVTLYRGDAFPAEYRRSAFVGVAGNNLVHRRTLVPNGVGFRAGVRPTRAPRTRRVPRLDRPLVPPRGLRQRTGRRALHCRPVSGDPRFLRRHSRIHQAIQGSEPRQRSRPDLPCRPGRDSSSHRCRASGEFSTAELVTTLNHPNAWHRETASRLLYARQDKSAIPALARLSEEAPSPLGRLHALYTLDGLDALAEAYVLRALDDQDPGVREHGVRLSERIVAAHGLSDALWRRLKARVDDPDLRVRYQLAFTLGEIQHPERNDALVRLIKKDLDQPWMHAAVLSSLAEGTGEVFSSLAAQPGAGRVGVRPDAAERARADDRQPEQRTRAARRAELPRRRQGTEAGVLVPLRFRRRPAACRRSARAFSDRVQPIVDHALNAIRTGKVSRDAYSGD